MQCTLTANMALSLLDMCLRTQFIARDNKFFMMQITVSSSSESLKPRTVLTGNARSVHPVCALHVLERLLHVMSYTPFVDLLVSLLCPSPQTSTNISPDATPSASDQASDRATDRASSGHSASTSQPDSSPEQRPKSPARHHAEAAPAADGATGRPPQPQASPWQALFALHEHSLAYRECFLAVLHGEDSQLTAAAVRALVAVVQSKAVSENMLSACGQCLLVLSLATVFSYLFPLPTAAACTNCLLLLPELMAFMLLFVVCACCPFLSSDAKQYAKAPHFIRDFVQVACQGAPFLGSPL